MQKKEIKRLGGKLDDYNNNNMGWIQGHCYLMNYVKKDGSQMRTLRHK